MWNHILLDVLSLRRKSSQPLSTQSCSQRMCLPSQQQWCEEQPVLVSNARPSALKLLLASLEQKHILLLSQAQQAKSPTDNPSQLPLGATRTGLEFVLEESVQMDGKYSLCILHCLEGKPKVQPPDQICQQTLRSLDRKSVV